MNAPKAFVFGIGMALALASIPAWADSVVPEGATGVRVSRLVATPTINDQQRNSRGFGYIRAGKPNKAIAEFDAVIAASDSRHLGESGQRFCARDERDAARIAQAAKASGARPVLVDSSVCDAYFGKGFALVDMGRGDLAEAELRRAAELAPFDAHYANEYAELYKSRRDWKTSQAVFTRAWDVVDKDRAGPDAGLAARALRGIGYSEMMLGNLDEAERKFRQSLEFEPGSKAAQAELGHIARKKAIGS